MARPPSYVSILDKSGVFRVDERESLYYELRGPSTSSRKADKDLGGDTASMDKNDPSNKACRRVVLVMGAFGTLRWMDYLADQLAAEGFQVLTYNHRGIGPGGCCTVSGGAEHIARRRGAGAGGGARGVGQPGSSSHLRATSPRCLAPHRPCVGCQEGTGRGREGPPVRREYGRVRPAANGIAGLARHRGEPPPVVHRVPFYGRDVAWHPSARVVLEPNHGPLDPSSTRSRRGNLAPTPRREDHGTNRHTRPHHSHSQARGFSAGPGPTGTTHCCKRGAHARLSRARGLLGGRDVTLSGGATGRGILDEERLIPAAQQFHAQMCTNAA